jgi:hypothetical protein
MSTEPIQRSRHERLTGRDRARLREEAARDYAARSSIRAVAAHLRERYGSVSYGLARTLLLEAGVPLRPKSVGKRRT